MQWYGWLIIGIVAFLILSFVGMIIAVNPIADMVFRTQFTRPEDPEAGWTRYKCSFPDNEENMDMHNQGMAWAEANSSVLEEVSITSFDGLKLCGQYFDFGFDKTALFLAGRAEPCTYSYFFAMPYKEYGYNVLVIDARSNGLSEGNYSCAGMKEYRDTQDWLKFLHDEKGMDKVVIHGICLGSAAGLRAVTHEGYSENVQGLVVDGVFTTFFETLRTHTIEKGKPPHPVCELVAWKIKKFTGNNVMKEGPVVDIKNYHGPILMLHGKQDVFSLPKFATKMFKSSPSKNKKLVWFDEGMHSHLKICAQEKYDAVVGEFLQTLN